MTSQAPPSRLLLRVLWIFCGVSVCLWTATYLFTFIRPASAYAGYPLFPSEARFSDYEIYFVHFRHFHKPDFYSVPGYPFVYPALVGVVLSILYRLPQPTAAFGILSLLVFIAGAVLLGRQLVRWGVPAKLAVGCMAVMFLASFPMWFTLDRANAEVINFVFVMLFVWAAMTYRWRMAAVFLGIAIALKIFPFILLGYFLCRRRYKELLLSIATAIGATAGALLVIGPPFLQAAAWTKSGLEFFTDAYALRLTGAAKFDHALFGSIKVAVDYVSPAPVHAFTGLYHVYLLVAALVSIAVFVFLWLKRPRINQLAVLLTLSVLIPPTSYDYTLIHIYGVIGLLLFFAARAQLQADAHIRKVTEICIFISAVITAPLAFFSASLPLGGVARCFALCVLTFLLTWYPMPDAEDETGRARPGIALPNVI